MRNAQPCRPELPQGQIHRFFWAVQPAVRQAFAANRHPKGHINGFFWASKPAVCQPPRRFKTPKTPKTLKTLQTLQKRLGMPNRAGAKATPKATYLAFSGRSQRLSLFARRSQPTGTPRPHHWLLMGVQACRLPAPKPLKPLKPLKRF